MRTLHPVGQGRKTLFRAAFLGTLAIASIAIGACAKEKPKPAPQEVGSGPLPALPTTPGEPGSGASCGFPSAATAFALPVLVGVPASTFKADTGSAMCASGGATLHYALRDMDGDQQPDLVVDSACDDATIGTIAWRIYRNTGAAFDPTPIRFTMPQPILDPSCAKTAIVDVDGDLKPDLVVLSLCTDASVGSTRWLVYPNVGTGFATPPVPFALPNDAPPGSFTALSRDTPACNGGIGPPAYAFFDIDGDRRNDLVITDACNDLTVGTTSWRVHRNVAGGVDPNVLLFALPTSPAVTLGAFPSSANRPAACSASVSTPSYSLLDFNGDFKPDLVVTQACHDTTVGATRWLLYPNSGTGFATSPVDVTLPTIAAAPLGSFPTPSADPACASLHPSYITVDTTADFKPDLLVTRACADPSVGATHWLLYPNGDAGLSTTSEPFTLPPVLGGTVTQPLGFGGAASCTVPLRQGFFMSYLAHLKLHAVVTDVCGDPTVGTSRWLVYESSCL